MSELREAPDWIQNEQGDVVPRPVPFPVRAFLTLAGSAVAFVVVAAALAVVLGLLAHAIVDLIVVGWNAGGWR